MPPYYCYCYTRVTKAELVGVEADSQTKGLDAHGTVLLAVCGLLANRYGVRAKHTGYEMRALTTIEQHQRELPSR